MLNPAAQELDGTERHIDLRDTILDAPHLAEAFPNFKLQFHLPDGTTHVVTSPKELAQHKDGSKDGASALPPPPYRVTFPPFNSDKEAAPLPEGAPEPPDAQTLAVQSYVPAKRTPFPELQPRRNTVRV